MCFRSIRTHIWILLQSGTDVIRFITNRNQKAGAQRTSRAEAPPAGPRLLAIAETVDMKALVRASRDSIF